MLTVQRVGVLAQVMRVQRVAWMGTVVRMVGMPVMRVRGTAVLAMPRMLAVMQVAGVMRMVPMPRVMARFGRRGHEHPPCNDSVEAHNAQKDVTPS